MPSIPLTLGLAYSEFGYNGHPATTSRFLCIKLADSNVTKVWLQRAPTYNEHFLLRPFTLCKRDPLSDQKASTVQWNPCFTVNEIKCCVISFIKRVNESLKSCGFIYTVSVCVCDTFFTPTKRRARAKTDSDADTQQECNLNKLITDTMIVK